MPARAKPITFVIPGQRRQAPRSAAPSRGKLKDSALVGARRGGGESVRLTAVPGEDVLALSILSGPTLYLHPESARDLMLAQSASATRGERAPDGGEVQVPARLGWPGLESGPARGATRGFLGQVWLQAVDVIGGLFKDKITDWVGAAVTKKLDGRVDAGVYALRADKLDRLEGRKETSRTIPAGDGPILVLVHGTFVDTSATFGKLWEKHPERVGQLFEYYGNRVYALDHPTVGVSPIRNALALAEAMPKGAKLHLLTHSRGGMVAEILARVCGGQGLGDVDLARFDESKYPDYREDLEQLAAAVKGRVSVDRMVRVACPARGTLLASRRLDAYLSVLKWGLELASVPVAPELLDFLMAVAGQRGDPEKMPGLEAMMPGSAVTEWLNAPADPIPGQLRAVAGDIQGDSILSWLKTLVSDLFYWTDNDLVVQTRSMYGGTPRADEGATFALDRGGGVTHFNYFANDRTVDFVAQGLTEERPKEFRPIGPASWAGQDPSGTRGARAVARSRTRPKGQLPAVFVLPGILGSNLALDGKRVWLSARFFNSLKDLAWSSGTAKRIRDDGPVSLVYDDLFEYLADTHEVFPFGFDWRRPIEDEARRLADAVDAALNARTATQSPVRIVAHSMGGLLARVMLLERPEVWRRMMDRDGARLLMLGTPNAGSWAPMQVLSGDDTFGNVLAHVGALFDARGARQTMAGMPGFLQLQAALIDPALGLDQEAQWKALADEDLKRLREHSFWHSDPLQLGASQWGIPPQAVLAQAVKLRRRLDEQAGKLGADAQKMLLVVGNAHLTPTMFEMNEDGLDYLEATDGGDGRVTFESASLPGVEAWSVDAAHGDLPGVRSAFDGYLELLTGGRTDKLERAKAPARAVRGVGASVTTPLVRSRPSRVSNTAEPPSAATDVLAVRDALALPAADRATPALRVVVTNGNLKFVSEALMLGHYASNELTGGESTVDKLIGGAMGESLDAGAYPLAPGSSQVFLNTRRNPNDASLVPRPPAVIVVGLGEEGNLRMSDLRRTVRQGAIAYSLHVSQGTAGGPAGFSLAATLIGSGGTGVHAGTAAQAIAMGVREANETLQRIKWPMVTELRLIELYLDRASEAHHSISVLAEAHPRDYVLSPEVEKGTGPLRRPPDAGYRGASYDFVSALQLAGAGGPLIEYTLDSGRARNEVRAQVTQRKLVKELIAVGADNNNADPQIGRTLFQLLVPVEIDSFLSGSNAIVLQLDKTTAGIPWEMLESPDSPASSNGQHLPWAIRAKVLRKLRTPNFRENPVAAGSGGGVLVIGEPQTSSDYAELPSAREEAEIVAGVLDTAPLLQPDALQAINALLAKPYRIVHIAGHGEVDSSDGTGVVLSKGVLGPSEIRSMRTVPELVFINCCHLGVVRSSSNMRRNALGGRRAEFAATVAEQLIQNGVTCVVAAGWAIEDRAAKVFAERFYQQLLAGSRFIDSVGEAREAAWRENPRGNTWAAYQCYGNPDWRFQRKNGNGASDRDPPVVSSLALELMLETAAANAKYDDAGPEGRAARAAQLESVRKLEALHGKKWGSLGSVAEAFGLAFAESGDPDAAIRWYERAVKAGDGGASFKAFEQLANHWARRGEKKKSSDEIRAAISLLEQLTEISAHPTGRGRKGRGSRSTLEDGMATSERESLLGSAWKRLSMVKQPGGQRAALQAVARAAQHYGRAEELARIEGAKNLFYPAMNSLAAELHLAWSKGRTPPLSSDRVAAIHQSLEQAEPEFWSVAATTELRMLEQLAKRDLAPAYERILSDFRDLKTNVPAPWMWDSVITQVRFTLDPYEKNIAQGAERNAAKKLLEELEALAKPR